jgi:hypothetical protein
MKKLYGILEQETHYGVQAHTLDLEKQEFITSHFCSSESFAKSDLGFSEPLFKKCVFSNDTHSTVYFNSSVLKKYHELYPDGFELIWRGKVYDEDFLNACMIARLKNIKLSSEILDSTGFSAYYDQSEDFGRRQLGVFNSEKFYTVYDMDETTDQEGNKTEQHFCDESFSEMKTMYDLYTDYEIRTGKKLF